MKTLLATAFITLTTATGALAASTAMDAYHPVKNQSAIDHAATASIGNNGGNAQVTRDRLGDGSPQYVRSGGQFDFKATSSISGDRFDFETDRLGDGSPRYK